jgi:hypothetical protein
MSDLAKTVLVSMAKPSIPDRGGGLIGDRRGLGRYPRTRLHAARLAAGLSQTQVAEKLGMSQKAYAGDLCGKRSHLYPIDEARI